MDLSNYLASGVNNPAKQVSVTKWNEILNGLQKVTGISPFHHGATSGTRTADRTFDITGISDQAAAVSAAIDAAVASTDDFPVLNLSGVWALGSTLDIEIPQSRTMIIIGGCFKAIDGVTLDTGIKITNLGRSRMIGEMYFSGNGGTAYADRLVTTGIDLRQSTRGTIDYLRCDHVKRFGVDLPDPPSEPGRNILTQIGLVKGQYCGSNRPSGTGAQAGIAFTARSDTGSAGSAGQASVLTVGAGNVPSEWQAADLVKIDSHRRPYTIVSTDNTAGTVTVHPWLDPTTQTTGTIYSMHGGLMSIDGGDTSGMVIDRIDALSCGSAVWLHGLYGVTINSLVGQQCGSCLTVGEPGVGGSTHFGSAIYGFHSEADEYDILDLGTGVRNMFISGVRAMGLSSASPLDKSFRIVPLTSSGGRGDESLKTYTINMGGVDYNSTNGARSYDQSASSTSVSNSPVENDITVSGQNSPTITLNWIDNSARAIGGTHTCAVRLFGTGSNNEPTGTVTVNAGTVAVSTTSNGTTTVTPSSLTNLIPGMQVTGTGVPGGTTISSINENAGTIVLSNSVPTATNTLTYQYNITYNGSTATSHTFSGLTAPLHLFAAMRRSTGTWQLSATRLGL